MTSLFNKQYNDYVTFEEYKLSIDNIQNQTAEQLIANIQSIRENAVSEGMVKEGSFEIVVEEDYYEAGFTTITLQYSFIRRENEREKQDRLLLEQCKKDQKAAQRKAAAEKRALKKTAEYAEYIRLKEKFEKVEK